MIMETTKYRISTPNETKIVECTHLNAFESGLAIFYDRNRNDKIVAVVSLESVIITEEEE